MHLDRLCGKPLTLFFHQEDIDYEYQLAFVLLQRTANLGGLTHESLTGSWAGLTWAVLVLVGSLLYLSSTVWSAGKWPSRISRAGRMSLSFFFLILQQASWNLFTWQLRRISIKRGEVTLDSSPTLRIAMLSRILRSIGQPGHTDSLYSRDGEK